MTGWRAVLVWSAAWAAFGLLSGWLVTAIPNRWLSRDRGPLRLFRFEAGGRWHERHLHIKRWKDRVPDAGDWFERGRSKSALPSLDRHGLAAFAVETRRAEWVHWANVAFGVSFFAWTPWYVGVVMATFGVAMHGPFIAVQRYNRARIGRTISLAAAPVRHRGRRLVAGGLVATAAVTFLVIRPEPMREVTVAEARERLAAIRGSDRPVSDSTALRPREGVYRYQGTGTEALDRPPVSQVQGPSMPGTVVPGAPDAPGCWTFRIDYSSKHHQSWDYCARRGDLVEVGGSSRQLLDLIVTDVEVTSTTRCEPRTLAIVDGARPGAVEQQTCTATLSSTDTPVTSSGTNTFVGVEDITVGGRSIEVLHYRRERTFSGGQTGTEVLDLWFDRRSALPIRNRRSVEAQTDSPLGRLTYTEEGTFTLEDVDP